MNDSIYDTYYDILLEKTGGRYHIVLLQFSRLLNTSRRNKNIHYAITALVLNIW